MSSLVQTRNPLVPAASTTPESQPSVDSAFSKGVDEALKGLVQGENPVERLLGGKSEGMSAEAKLAQETVRTLDDGSFKGIATADRVAALEISKRIVSEDQTRVQRMQELALPTKAVEGYKPTDLIQRLVNDIVLQDRSQLLSSRRSVSVRSARDSLNWLLKGVTALTTAAATLLGRSAGQSASQSDRGEQGARALGLESPELDEGLEIAPRELQAPRDPDSSRRKPGLRLIPEDDEN